MSASDLGGLRVLPDELDTRSAWLDPFDWYREMRETAPVRYDPDRYVWDVFRYDDVKTVMDDDELFSASPRNATDFEEPEGEDEGLILDTMLLQDPPRHDELRSVVDDAFEPRAVRELEPRIREVADSLLDEALVGTTGEIDLVSALSYPLPVIVIAELLGVPESDRDQFRRWSHMLTRAASDDVDTEEFMREQREAGEEMATYFLTEIQDRRQEPRDDLLTTIATEEGSGGRLSHREALGTCILLLVAGNITTTNLITNAVRCFGEADGDLYGRVARDEQFLTSAVEEVLRYRSPVQAMTRVAMEDVELGGETIEAGETLAVWLGSANHDDRQFAEPGSFRPGRSPNQHLAFGHGTHYCLGAPLARLEAKVALSTLADRLSTIELADAELQPTRSSFVYGVESLPVQYEKGSNDGR